MDKQFLNEVGLQKVADNVNKRLKTVETMPVNPKDKQIVLYVGETSGDFVQGHIYEYKDSLWLCYKTTPEVDPSGTHYVYLNSDKTIAANTHTGELAQSSSDFESINPIPSEFIVRDDGIYFNDGSGDILSYVRDSQNDLNESKWTDITSSGTVDQSFNPISSNAQSGIAVNEAKTVLFNKLFAIDTWKNNTWVGVNQFYGNDIWKLDDNIYLSSASNHYVLNQTTMEWEPKTWNGCSEFSGSDIWFQGNNVYLSFTTQSGEEHYVLNKATDTWEEKTWHNVSELSGSNVWKDFDGNIYNYFTQKLDVATDTWEDLTDFQPDSYSNVQDLFYYKNNIYYISFSKTYLFNSSTRTWTDAFISWRDLNLLGEYMWNDGTNIYYSYFDSSSSDHRYSKYYILNQTTDEWETMTWKGDIGLDGYSTWTDGKDWYCSHYETYPTTVNYQLKLTKTLKTYID